ncbi:hypothetical protein D3C81_428300 [compost metagenome]
MKRPQDYPLAIRTAMNWKLYRGYIKQYQDTNYELFEKLMKYTAMCGFNRGVEQFTLEESRRNFRSRKEREKQLVDLASLDVVTLEQMLEKQKRMEEIAEAQKTWVYEPQWKPTANEILNRGYLPTFEEKYSSETFYRIYHAYDKVCYVAISAVKGYRTEVYVDVDAKNVKDRSYNTFKTLISDLPNLYDEMPVRTKKKRKIARVQVDIDHVKKAMGIEDGTSNNKTPDIPDDIF